MREQFFYGHGKLLLTGEYFVLDGAKSIALPTTLGQNMSVKYKQSNEPKLFWKSFDNTGNCWFEASFELWHFNCLDNDCVDSQTLQQILLQARKQNVHFLREDVDVFVETHLEFPLNWGLGSSSTLIYNIAQWAYISPFELLQQTLGGSGYDIACAQSPAPIVYELKETGPRYEQLKFNPVFKDKLYFLYLNKKQNTQESVKRYRDLYIPEKSKISEKINSITEKMLVCFDLKEFEQLVFEHENLLSMALDLPRVQDQYFNDYWGAVKSLGAWGGDFALVTSDMGEETTSDYFQKRGFDTLLKYDDLIYQNQVNIDSHLINSSPDEISNSLH